MNTFQDCLEYLYRQLPMYQRVGKAALKPDLSNTIALMDLLGHPDRSFKSIHIAGTNGKGTSAHALASILQSAGYKTGLYTSPHLKSFTERIKVNGHEIPEDWVLDFVLRHKKPVEAIGPSFFEWTVALAFSYFASQEVDVAVIEVGLGGRLDSTNVIRPEMCLITSIGYDHTDLLGDTLDKIAAEKAGIIKPKTPVVIGSHQEETWPVFKRKAQQENAPITLADSNVKIINRKPHQIDVSFDGEVYSSDICADYFAKNLPGIIESVHQLQDLDFNIGDKDIKKGLANINSNTGLKGRYQLLSTDPTIIADVSHNEPGVRTLIHQVLSSKNESALLHIVFGTVKDKQHEEILSLLPTEAIYYFTQSSVARSLDAITLQRKAREHQLSGEAYGDVNEAIMTAKKNASSKDFILITGSTFVVAEIKEL